MHADALAELRKIEVGVLDVPAHAEVGAVDLQHQAGLRDGLVFVAHRLGDGVKIGLVVLVVVVAKNSDTTPGEAALRNPPADVTPASAALRLSTSVRAACGSRTLIGALQAGRLAARAAGIAEHALRQAREFGEVLVDEGVAGAAEAVQAVLDVGGVARLRQFAVVDEIDAGLGLLADHLGHRRAHACGQRRAIDRHAFLLGVHHPDQIVGPRQAAGVGAQKSVDAALHPGSPHKKLRA